MALMDAMSTEEINQWFKIDRHDDATSEDAGETSTKNTEADDDEEAARLLADATAEGEDDDSGEEDDDPEGADQLGDKGKKALDRMKAERAAARKEAAAAKKQLADLAKKVQEFEDRDKSELEKATAKAERLAEEAAKATARAVRAEVRALSVDQFADPSDAADVLMRDPSKYVDGSSGEIDEDAIRADLEDLLERKPHWRKPEPAAATEPKKTTAKPKPKPDPGQGGRGEKPIDFRTADEATVAAEYAKYGIRPRR